VHLNLVAILVAIGDMAETKDTSNRLCSSCTLTLTQFFLLLGKNFLLQIRRPIGTIFEIFIPIAAVIIIVGFRIGLFTPEDRCFVTFESDPLIIPFMGSYNIYYAPNDTEANALAGYITPKLASSSGSLIGVETEDNLVQAINEYRNTSDRVKGCFLDGVGKLPFCLRCILVSLW
jgi:ATP-binding cassette subfamily A (ABC1) protein 3